MRTLTPISQTVCAVLELCADSIRDVDVKAKLRGVSHLMSAVEANYLAAGATASLFTIPMSGAIGGMGNADMKKVYKNTFVKSAKTRLIYDSIIALPQHGICPQCAQNAVSTLDHYLAETYHSALVITPANLIPCCGDCNKAKLHAQPATADEQTLHPYFDVVDDAVWLRAKVIEGSPPVLRFFAEPDAGWDESKQRRVLYHFSKFKLGRLYATQSGAELTSIKHSLLSLADRAGPEGVRNDLRSRAFSAAKDQRNAWRTAMYAALAESDWFCSDGLRLLAGTDAAP